MKEIKKAKPRQLASSETLEAEVKKIIEDVRAAGDAALAAYNEKFDGCKRFALRISREEIEEAYGLVPQADQNDIREVANNIIEFAKEQRRSIRDVKAFEPTPGIYLGQNVIPVGSACCYVPGGSYPLFSTALMLGVPANIAGVERVIACSPAARGTDKIHPYTLVALDIAGVDEIYAVGGAQAIAAAAYGTDEIAPVDLVVGPGNSYVTEAKRQCYGKVGIDFLAGPSEVLIIADETADPKIVAADMLAQSEHDSVAKAILVTTDEQLANAVIVAVDDELAALTTGDIAGRSWADYGEVLLAGSLDEAVAFANEYAPEHLEIITDNSRELATELKNYGSLFIGENTAEVFGDYASGTNHTLPTLGAAKYTGGVFVGTFLKICTQQTMSDEAAMRLAPLVSRLAEKEGLMAHKLAAEARLSKK